MKLSQWILLVSLSSASVACGGRTGDGNGLPANTAAIDFFNESSDTIKVSINNETPVELEPNSSQTFLRGFGAYNVQIDDTGDDLATFIPFANLGLQDQQRTVMVYRGRRGDRTLIGAESAVEFRNDSITTVAVYFDNINYGSVAPGTTQVFNLPSGTYQVVVDSVEDGLAVGEFFQLATLRPQSRTAMAYR